MDTTEFRKRGKEMIDYVADYLENIRDRQPFPDVMPGYMRELIPDEAPETPDKWEELFADIERVIMPGVTHWQSPHFHAYFPVGHSYPSILADILSDAMSTLGFTWSAGPVCTEMEVVMLDWVGKMLDLPPEFLFSSGGTGGGVIQGSASEATLVAMLSARNMFIHKMKKDNPELEDIGILSKLVAYCSDEAHSSVEKASQISMVKIRKLQTDKDALLGSTLSEAIEMDKSKGLIPIFVCATLGTTSSCAFDNIKEIGPLCEKDGIWMHIDAAYAGSAFICPEFRPLLDGVEYAMSFNFNPHKWMNVNFDCSTLWVKNRNLISNAFNVDPFYFKHKDKDQGMMPDYWRWEIPLGHRFRSLKLWFVLRLFGQTGLQTCIRKDVCHAHEFKELVLKDDRFEIVAEVVMGLVCFRLKGSNEKNENLLKAVNDDRRIYIIPAKIKDTYFLRFAICSNRTNSRDIQFAWTVITELTETVLKNQTICQVEKKC